MAFLVVSYTPPFIRIGSESRPSWTQGNLLPEKNPTNSGLEVQGVVPLPVFSSDVKMVKWVGKKHRGEKIPFFWVKPQSKEYTKTRLSKGCQFNPKGWWIDTLQEPFGTPLKVLVQLNIPWTHCVSFLRQLWLAFGGQVDGN